VLSRFERDALGLEVSVGDGRPNKTLPRAPYCVWINVGINDISMGVPLTETMENILTMVRLCREAGIVVGVNTCGPHKTHSADQVTSQKKLREFLMREVPKTGGYVFDFRSWFADPANPDMPNPALVADNVHPRGAGYLSYPSEIIKQTGAPIVMAGICVESKVDPDAMPTSYVPAKGVRLEDPSTGRDAVGRVADGEAVIANPFDMTNRKVLRVYVSEPDAFPISGAVWAGISRVYGVFGRAKLPETARRAFGVARHSTAAGWSILDTYPKQDVIDITPMSNTHLRVRFTRPVRDVSVLPVGNTRPFDFGVGITTSPNREVLVYVLDKDTGVALDPSDLTGTFFFSITAA